MRIQGILGNLAGRLFRKPVAEPAEEETDYERMCRIYGLKFVDIHDEMPDLFPARDAMREAWERSDFLAYQNAFETARRGGRIAVNGKAEYLLVQDWFFEDLHRVKEDEAAAKLQSVRPAFEAFLASEKSPFAAALLHDLLRSTAFALRGTGTVYDVTSDQRAGFHACMELADEALDSQRNMTNYSWLVSDYRRSANTGSLGTFQEKFERVWSIDRYNIDLCRSHARMIMPRWLGDSEHDLENFARRAAELTKDRYGYGFYAWIQQANTEVGAHELSDTLCDPELVKRGFEDLYERFPAQSVLNFYADMLEWMEDTETLADLLETRLRSVIPQVWYGDTMEEQFEYAFATLWEAHEVIEARAAAR